MSQPKSPAGLTTQGPDDHASWFEEAAKTPVRWADPQSAAARFVFGKVAAQSIEHQRALLAAAESRYGVVARGTKAVVSEHPNFPMRCHECGKPSSAMHHCDEWRCPRLRKDNDGLRP